MTLFPTPSIGWDDVTQAIQSQKWIRGTVTYSDGKSSTMWLSPEQQVWAFRWHDSFYFSDGREQAKYEYHGGREPITKLPLGGADARGILPVDAWSRNQDAIGPWLFVTEKVVQQQRYEVKEAGKSWIEFRMVLGRGDMNQATLRVDPATRLPVHLLLASPTDKAKSAKWEFDYPADGPTDIYALGVPREIKIDDRMPADNVQQVLAAMASSRTGIGDFRLIVGQASRFDASTDCYPSSVVRRQGDRWRVDRCLPMSRPDALAEPAEKRNWGEWFEEQLERHIPIPLLICDGRTVWENSNFQPETPPRWQPSRHTAPQDLLSGEGLGNLPMAPYVKFASLLFPDLFPKPGWTFEFDPEPADAPGCLLLKRSARLATAEPSVGHEWYYVDPAKGHAVVRAELFTLPIDAPSAPSAARFRQTLRMEEFRQSPHGFWYPTIVRDAKPAVPGLKQPVAPERQGKAAVEPVRSAIHETTVRYHFDFDADLPDALFVVDEA